VSSIQRRMTWGLCAACTLLWSLGGLALYLIVRAGLFAEFDSALKANARAWATMTSQKDGRVIFDYDGDLPPAFRSLHRPDYFQMWLPDGSTLQRSSSLRGRDLALRAGAVARPELSDLTLPDGLPGRAISIRFVPHVDDEGPPSPVRLNGEVTLTIARHRGELDRRLSLLATALLVVGAVMAAATAFLVAVAVRRGLRPLSQLGARAAAIDASTLQLRFPIKGIPMELQPITIRLNNLLERLEKSFEHERRFSADVAHELRTPIAELRTLAEVALKWPEDSDMARDALHDALGVALQMEAIATGLLALARCERGLLPVHLEPVCLGPLIREISRSLNGDATTKPTSVSIDVPDDTRWLTDAFLLHAILSNLLSNAFQHSPAGGSIRLLAESNQLSVANSVDDLSPDDLPHLFQRFWRKDPARSSSEHSGLGLALAKAYAGVLGLELRAELTDTKEITFVLSGAKVCSPTAVATC